MDVEDYEITRETLNSEFESHYFLFRKGFSESLLLSAAAKIDL